MIILKFLMHLIPNYCLNKCNYLYSTTLYNASKSLAYATKFHSGQLNDV